MSTLENDRWLEAAQEDFDDALVTGNYPKCLDVIADTKSAGFVRESAQMEVELKNTPITQFIHKSPYQIVGDQMETIYNLARGKNADGSDKK